MIRKSFYITTPLYYVNAKPHIGHAYTEIACDCLARYMRMKEKDVLFLTGTDEHGQKIWRAAQDIGKEPVEFIDSIVSEFKRLWSTLDISYDDFIRTTEKRHIDAVKKVLTLLYDKGDIYQDEYRGFYCTPCETFWPSMQVTDNLCPDCKRPLEEVSEVNYFFRLSKYQQWLKDYIRDHPDFIRPDFRRNEVLGFLNEPLNDLCVSRPRQRLSWGIEIPFAGEHVTYVWFDALINYISGCGWADNTEKFNKFWPADVHVIGKDILRPHAVYWPIMLHALGIKLPKTVFAHGWWLISGEKMSKSKGNIIDPLEMVEKYGANALRHFLLREVSFGLDGTFSEAAFITRFNADLANDIGNLLNRSLTMVEKYFDGVIPEEGEISDADNELKKKISLLPGKIDPLMRDMNFSQALIEIWDLINSANKHIEVSAPWKMAKAHQTGRIAALLFILLEVLLHCAFFIYPFMPSAAIGIIRQLGIDIPEKDILFASLTKRLLKPGAKINKDKPLFPRIV